MRTGAAHFCLLQDADFGLQWLGTNAVPLLGDAGIPGRSTRSRVPPWPQDRCHRQENVATNTVCASTAGTHRMSAWKWFPKPIMHVLREVAPLHGAKRTVCMPSQARRYFLEHHSSHAFHGRLPSINLAILSMVGKDSAYAGLYRCEPDCDPELVESAWCSGSIGLLVDHRAHSDPRCKRTNFYRMWGRLDKLLGTLGLGTDHKPANGGCGTAL